LLFRTLVYNNSFIQKKDFLTSKQKSSAVHLKYKMHLEYYFERCTILRLATRLFQKAKIKILIKYRSANSS